MIADVTIDVILPSNCIYVQYIGCEGESSQKKRREQSYLPRETLFS